jgi:hypothetical protein
LLVTTGVSCFHWASWYIFAVKKWRLLYFKFFSLDPQLIDWLSVTLWWLVCFPQSLLIEMEDIFKEYLLTQHILVIEHACRNHSTVKLIHEIYYHRIADVSFLFWNFSYKLPFCLSKIYLLNFSVNFVFLKEFYGSSINVFINWFFKEKKWYPLL